MRTARTRTYTHSICRRRYDDDDDDDAMLIALVLHFILFFGCSLLKPVNCSALFHWSPLRIFSMDDARQFLVVVGAVAYPCLFYFSFCIRFDILWVFLADLLIPYSTALLGTRHTQLFLLDVCTATTTTASKRKKNSLNLFNSSDLSPVSPIDFDDVDCLWVEIELFRLIGSPRFVGCGWRLNVFGTSPNVRERVVSE